MKATKKIVGAACALVAAVALSAGSTLAWFSANTTVNADGMKVKVTASESLVIAKTVNVSGLTSVSFDTKAAALTPVTYVAEGTTYKYLTNGSDIDPATGLPVDGATATLEEVAGGSAASYYTDYVVYLAAAGSAMTGKTLTAKVTFSCENEIKGTLMAVTVDFAVLTATSSTATPVVAQERTATTNIKSASLAENKLSATSNVTLATSTQNFPLNTTGSSVPVIMRIYYDGALTDGTNAYVKSSEVNLSEVSVAVSFTVS